MIAAEYEDNYGERDIYKVDVSGYDLLSKGYENGTFGQILCTAVNKDGKPVKGIKVEILNASGKVMFAEETDRNGRVRASLLGNQTYKVVFTDGDVVREREVNLKLKAEGETLEKVEEKF